MKGYGMIESGDGANRDDKFPSKDRASRNSYLHLSLWTLINGRQFVQQERMLKLTFLA